MTTMGLEWEVKRVPVDISGSADLVAAVVGKKIRLLAFVGMLTPADATFKLQTGGAADLTGVLDFPSAELFTWPYNPAGWLETVAGAKLNAVLTGTSPTLDGFLTYAEVT